MPKATEQLFESGNHGTDRFKAHFVVYKNSKQSEDVRSMGSGAVLAGISISRVASFLV